MPVHGTCGRNRKAIAGSLEPQCPGSSRSRFGPGIRPDGHNRAPSFFGRTGQLGNASPSFAGGRRRLPKSRTGRQCRSLWPRPLHLFGSRPPRRHHPTFDINERRPRTVSAFLGAFLPKAVKVNTPYGHNLVRDTSENPSRVHKPT